MYLIWFSRCGFGLCNICSIAGKSQVTGVWLFPGNHSAIMCLVAVLTNSVVPRLDATVSVTNEGVWSTGGMAVTGGKPLNPQETCPNATLSTTKPKWAGLVSNLELRVNRPVTKHRPYKIQLCTSFCVVSHNPKIAFGPT